MLKRFKMRKILKFERIHGIIFIILIRKTSIQRDHVGESSLRYYKLNYFIK